MAAPVRVDELDSANQSPAYQDVDLFGSDQPLQDAVCAYGAASERAALASFGRRWGSAEMLDHGRLANENAPKLKLFDAKGYRRDVVEFHPSYHRLMAQSIADGLHAIDMKYGIGMFAHDATDFFDREQHPGFVVGHHHRYDSRFEPQSPS